MSLDTWECLKWNTFVWTTSTDQIPVNKDKCKKAVLYIYIGDRNKDLVLGSRLLDCVNNFTHSKGTLSVKPQMHSGNYAQ